MLHIIASSMHREEQRLPFELPAGWADSNQCVAVLTGGTEASFVELVNDGKIDLQQPIYLLASGQSNSLAASLEILAWIQQHGGAGRVLTSAAQIAVEESPQPDANTAVKKRNLHLFKTVYNRQNQMSPFCKTKRLKNSAHIHTEADTKTMPASVIL